MTSHVRILIAAALAASLLSACYVHPAPVDGGRRDAGPPDAPSADAGSLEDADDADASVPPACVTDDDCTADLCERAICTDGECTTVAVDDGTACDDEDLCTVEDACTAGACSGTVRACAACDGSGAVLTTLSAVWRKAPEALLEGADGAVIVTGFGDSDLWLGAVAADGAVLFDRAHGDETMGDWGYALVRDAEGRTIAGGYSQVDGGPPRPWLIEVDDAGDVVASHLPFGEREGVVQGIAPLPGGGMVVLASIGERATLARLSSELEIEWERSYFDVGAQYELGGVVVLPGGDLAIAAPVGVFPARSVRVVRVRPSGDVLWDRSLEADAVGAILARPDGTIVVVGRKRSESIGMGASWLARLDGSGIVVSQHTYGVDANGSMQSVSLARDGSLVLAGTDGGDALLIRTDADGALLEEARLSLGAHERADVVHVLSDGTIIVAGISDRFGIERRQHAWMARAGSLEELGCAD